ncbi:DUF4149 domain-containing protein [Variovorax dokdonensis]|uniref:DUF4149 domain-containing protein n=1 Tax=Variovorax dokdonensis TaxID=344883 RepID=A0ABT7N8R5_9BURK|nr:DUF4149 domain-containing protein [Variovorax dokdonensis]MDM0044332.1 DUF4149 domain-containing protein [Variovorax dokdonensis]
MRAFNERLPVLAAAFWWCSLTVVGFLVVPLLFRHLPTPALAGNMAAHLFTAQTWVSMGCAVLLLGLSRSSLDAAPSVDAAVLFIILGLLLALVVEFGVAPRIVARQNLKMWHGVGTGLYLAQWACAGAVLWRLLRPPQSR